jgi:exopolysaccharide production protein ExoZ
VKQKSSKIENLQFLRGMAVLLVVGFHLLAVETKYSPGDGILPDLFVFGASGVDLFFVISGFVMVTVTRGHFQSFQRLYAFLYKRVTRIYPLYWCYSAVVLAVYLQRPELVNAAQGHRVNILASFLLLPQNLLPLLAVGWSLIHEMYFYLVFAALMLAPEKHLSRLLVVWSALVIGLEVLALSGAPGFTSAGVRLAAHPLTGEFIFGALAARLIFAQKIRGGGLPVLFSGCALLLAGFVSYGVFNPGSLPDGWMRVFMFGVPYAAIVYGAVAVEKTRGVVFSRAIRRVGDTSYSIYLSHVLVISFFGRIWNHVAVEGILDNLLVLPTMLAAVILTGSISYRFLERPMLMAARRFNAAVSLRPTPAEAAPATDSNKP